MVNEKQALVSIALFGSFELTVNEQAIDSLRSAKGQALLAYLALNKGNPVRRGNLCALLWPDSPLELSRTNLRQSLTQIRKALGANGEPALLTQGREVSLCPDLVTVDVSEFENLAGLETRESMEAADKLYQGDLLESLNLEDSPLHEQFHIERRRLQEMQVQLCHRMIAYYTNADALDSLQTASEKLLRIDPLDEIAHRGLMQFYWKDGRNNAALRQFRSLQKLLKEQLQTAPSIQTQEMYRTIMHSQDVGIANPENVQLLSTSVNEESLNTKPGPTTTKTTTQWHRNQRFSIGLSLLLICVVGFGYMSTDKRNTNIESGVKATNASNNKPDSRQSIAVLPFKNLSSDPEQLYFSDGLSEDLISDLSRVSNLDVIARASSFLYRDEATPLDQIANELGVRHLLLGSVRKQDDRLRINVQLVDAYNGMNLWSDRYDRSFADVLTVQDEIARIVVGELSVNLTDVEQARFDRRPVIDPDAYDLLLQALGPVRHLTGESSLEARALLQQAIELDPDYARAYANLSLTYQQDVTFQFSNDHENALKLGFEAITQAVALDEDLPQVQFALAGLHLAALDHKKAALAARHAIRLDPNYADGHGTLAQVLMFAGDLDGAMASLDTAKRINPGFTFTYLWVEGQIYLLRKDFESARRIFEDINSRNPSFVSGRLLLLSVLGHLQDNESADWEIAELLTMVPDYQMSKDKFSDRYLNAAHKLLYIEGLRLAGLP